eukprot:CAMPEP_0197036252 /NCGR_PEP_ID=MMETSP1384-20130603/13821_1 /TAXON_ID=29189 /ORGANISM="Ammonia sp." /LENGTH=406 /DNA_ID=CAMNT_0042466413 /DNA_START=34 /DNA_END=1254 /DNA_ORIENTATION=+
MGATCCSLPSSTPITIKACFTRCDLEDISLSDTTLQYQENVAFISHIPLYKPHLDFECSLQIGDTYNHFIAKLSQIISSHVHFNRFVLDGEMQYIRYETAYGLQVYTFQNSGKRKGKLHDITFNELFYHLSFVDWSSGYSLIIWFDAKCFQTNLDLAIEQRDIHRIHKLLQIGSGSNDEKSVQTKKKKKSECRTVTRGGANDKYVELEGEETVAEDGGADSGEEVDYYPFPIIENDVYGLLSMDDELITKHVIRLDQQAVNQMNARHIDFYLDSNSLLLCVEQFYDVSKNMLIEYDLPSLFKLSPFYVIQWHATRFNENTCYLLARNGCFNIREKDDKNIVKIQEFANHHLNPRNIEGIKRGTQERQKLLTTLLKDRVEAVALEQLSLFDTGNWKIFNEVVVEKKF